MITFFLLTMGLFFLFIVLLFIGIVQKRRKPIYISLIQKAYKKIKTTKIQNPFKRSGMEMYTAVLGKPETNCVTVINSQDAYIPKIDCCIWLEFTTCPKELARIITERELKFIQAATRYPGDSSTAVTSENSFPNYSPKPNWFVPENLGAGYLTFQKFNPDDPNHDLILFFSKDSTRGYYCDMAE